MRILQIVADGTPGGGTINVLGLIEDILSDPGSAHKIDFVSQSDSHAIEQGETLGATCFGIDFFRSRFDIRAAIAIRRLVSHRKPDLIHFHGGRAAFFGNWLPGAYSVPTIYTVRGYHFLKKPWLLRHLAISAERRINRQVDVTVLVSADNQRLGRAWDLFPASHQTMVIHNGIDAAALPLPISGDPRQVGFLGRLDYPKDPHFVLDIAEILAPEGFRFTLNTRS